MKVTVRSLHRDLGYFYLGLIIAFSVSGIFLNHRRIWHPSRYRAEVQTVTLSLPAEPDQAAIVAMGQQMGISDAIRRFKVENGKLEVSFENHDLKADLLTGTGELVRYVKVPVLAQMTQLHQDTNDWWIYYSDIFGLSMLLIAITGMIMIPKGDKSFGGRGWKLAVAGLIFPLIFLFLLS